MKKKRKRKKNGRMSRKQLWRIQVIEVYNSDCVCCCCIHRHVYLTRWMVCRGVKKPFNAFCTFYLRYYILVVFFFFFGWLFSFFFFAGECRKLWQEKKDKWRRVYICDKRCAYSRRRRYIDACGEHCLRTYSVCILILYTLCISQSNKIKFVIFWVDKPEGFFLF